MKKQLSLLILLLFPTLIFAQETCPAGTYYKMASYGADGQTTPRTPLFDIRVFDQQEGCFRIATQQETGVTSYGNGIQFLFDLMIGISIALAVILFTFGAAEGIILQVNSKAKVEGQTRMQNAIIGLLIILGMWLIINTINPDLLRLPALQGLYEFNAFNASPEPGKGVVGRPGA